MGASSSKKTEQRQKRVIGLRRKCQPPSPITLPPNFNFSGKPLQGLGPFEPDNSSPSDKNEPTPVGSSMDSTPERQDLKTSPREQEASKNMTFIETGEGRRQSPEQLTTRQSEQPLQNTEMETKEETIASSVKLHIGLHYPKNSSSEREDSDKKQLSASHVNVVKYAENDRKAINVKQSSFKVTIGTPAATSSIFTKPPDRSPQIPQPLNSLSPHKEQKDLLHCQEKAQSQKISSIILTTTAVPIKHTKTIDQPEDGSKSSHHTVETSTIVSKYTGKGSKETHPSLLDKPSLNTVFSQQKIVGPQLIKVKISSKDSLDSVKSPIYCQVSGDSSKNVPLLCEKNASSLDTLSKPIKKKKSKKHNKLKKVESQKVEAGNLMKERVASPETSETNPGFKVCSKSGWNPFNVNQSCPTKTHCNHGRGLPPNVKKWFAECPNYLCESPWATTAKVAAFVALRQIEDREEQPEEN